MAHPGYQSAARHPGQGGPSALPPDPLAEPPRPERVVFTVGATAYRRRHLVTAARVRGEWEPLVREAREELACAARAAECGDPLEQSVVSAARAAFRRSAGLLAADDLEAWLAERDVAVADWLAHTRNRLLRDAWLYELDALPRAAAPSDPELARAAWTLAVCDGALGEIAERLAVEAAAEAALSPRHGAELDPDTLADADVTPATLERRRIAGERLVEQAVTSARVAREIEAHRLGWTTADCVLLVHPDPDVLREAALCVVEDGLELEAVARAAGGELRRSRLVLGELPPDVAARLFATEPGELLGPLAVESTGWLVLLEAKTTPSTAEPEIRERAVGLIAARERARAVDDWVRWHERL